MDGNWNDEKYSEHYNRLYATTAEEFGSCLKLLRLSAEDSIIDIGCGNGDFLLLASGIARTALGVDISEDQVAQARKKLAGRPGAEVVLSSFLDFRPGGRFFSKGFSRKALHHLKDPEKETFLMNIAPAFRQGAVFLLEDGIYFEFSRSELDRNWDRLMADAAAYYGDSWEMKKKDLIHSFREEFAASADEWTRIFDKAGFSVTDRMPKNSFYGTLIAVKR